MCLIDVQVCNSFILFSGQEDYRKITVERKGEQNFFTSEMIKTCMRKVVPVNLHQTVQVSVVPVNFTQIVHLGFHGNNKNCTHRLAFVTFENPNEKF